MTNDQSSFSFPSYRRLCKYLGETDAMVELTELAAREFLSGASQSGDIAGYVSTASDKHGVRVNLTEVDHLSLHLARNYIVTVYQSAERFFHEFRKDHCYLYKNDWSGDGHDLDPLTVTLKNIATTQTEAETLVGVDLISRFQYYRIVRNHVVHTKESSRSKPKSKYDEIIDYSPEHADLFGLLNVPSPPESLNFDDFIFFSRVTKFMAKKICMLSKPPEDHWINNMSLQKKFGHLQTKPERMKYAMREYLRTEYGMDEAAAEWIVGEVLAH